MIGTVLITGAGRGLGEALAVAFSQRGHPIILQGRNEENLHRVQKGLQSDSSIVVGDIRDTKVLDSLLNIAHPCSLEVLINNAGMPSLGMPFSSWGDDQIDEMIQTNLTAPMKLIRRLYPLLSESKGKIVNINSVCGLEPKAKRVPYCASRWGMRGLSASLRLECEQDGIRVISVYPSRIKSRPEYTFGNEVSRVVDNILFSCDEDEVTCCVIDDRPSEFRNYGEEEHV